MAGTITFDHQYQGRIGRLVATCTADAADGTFPATAIPPIDGRLVALITNPGATAPTDNWDLTLVDDNALDRLGGVGANRDTTTSERVAIPGAPACASNETLTLTPTGNSVNSAIVVITLLYDTSGGAAELTNPYVEVSATPTLDTSAYASGDSLHTAVLTFENAVRVAGGSGYIDKMVILDKAKQSATGVLWLFRATVTPATANAAHSISDADAAKCVGYVQFGPYKESALNSVSNRVGVNHPFEVDGTSLFGILVTEGAPTYGASDLVVTLGISQN